MQQPSQAEDILNEVQMTGKTIAEAHVDDGFVRRGEFWRTVANDLATEYHDLPDTNFRRKC